ncbi:MAG: hypothetical protein JWN34_3685 [Bryobacterales bacterium]|nr:hypothetical protein [Bryobacterales bacterium]
MGFQASEAAGTTFLQSSRYPARLVATLMPASSGICGGATCQVWLDGMDAADAVLRRLSGADRQAVRGAPRRRSARLPRRRKGQRRRREVSGARSSVAGLRPVASSGNLSGVTLARRGSMFGGAT